MAKSWGGDRFDSRRVALRTVSAYLSQGSKLKRRPRAPGRPRSQAFWAAFEDRALVYDAFWSDTGQDVLLVGPPPLNLMSAWHNTTFVAEPSGTPLDTALFPSRSTMITRLGDVPPDTEAISFSLDGEGHTLPIQPGLAPTFAGRKVLFTINKNNRLDWVRFWADWHVRLHGTDAVILFDNGSDLYALADLEETLLSVPGLEKVCVVSLPHKFGPVDKSVLMTRFYPRFLQISAVNIALRRCGMQAAGLINCDIDELVWAHGRSVYDIARRSELGTLRLRGRWIEAVRDPDPAHDDHRAFSRRFRDGRHKLSPSKCVIDPMRPWMQDLRVQPYLHRIHGAPRAARRHTDAALFFHFRGINTNWKENRTEGNLPRTDALVTDPDWAAARRAYFESE